MLYPTTHFSIFLYFIIFFPGSYIPTLCFSIYSIYALAYAGLLAIGALRGFPAEGAGGNEGAKRPNCSRGGRLPPSKFLAYHLPHPLCVLGAAAVGVVVEKHLDLAAFAGGLLDDGDKVGKLVVAVVVAVARGAVAVMGCIFWAGEQSRQRVMVLKAFFFLRVVFFCVPGGGVAAVQPDVRDFPGKGKAAFLGLQTVFVRKVLQFRHVAERQTCAALGKPLKNGRADPFGVAEFHHHRKAPKLGQQRGKVKAVLVCVMKALRKLKKRGGKAFVLGQRL